MQQCPSPCTDNYTKPWSTCPWRLRISQLFFLDADAFASLSSHNLIFVEFKFLPQLFRLIFSEWLWEDERVGIGLVAFFDPRCVFHVLTVHLFKGCAQVSHFTESSKGIPGFLKLSQICWVWTEESEIQKWESLCWNISDCLCILIV